MALRVEHATASTTAGAEKLHAAVSSAEDFIASEPNPLVAVDHDPALRRLDLHRQPLAGPA
jgi:hypothetical protein